MSHPPGRSNCCRFLGLTNAVCLRTCVALCPNWQDAEEIMQQVRIRIWQDFDQYDPAKPFGCWARAIAYYLTLAYRKERSRQREFFSERILEEVSLTYEMLAETANERRTALVRCLEKLGAQKRRVIEEYYLSAEPSQRIADQPVDDSQRAAAVAVPDSQNVVRVRRAGDAQRDARLGDKNYSGKHAGVMAKSKWTIPHSSTKCCNSRCIATQAKQRKRSWPASSVCSATIGRRSSTTCKIVDDGLTVREFAEVRANHPLRTLATRQ